MTHDPSESGPPPTEPTLTRRTVLAGAGLALAGGAGLAAASAAAAEEQAVEGVALAPKGSTAVEFRFRIAQSGSAGEAFTGYGYLIRVHGLPDSALFAGSPPNDGSALLTAFATG